MAGNAEGKGILVKADSIAQAFRAEVQTALAGGRRPLTLVGVLGTASAPSAFYAEFTRRQCEEFGIRFELRRVGAALDSEEGRGEGEGAKASAIGEGVEEAIVEANEDEGVDGIMVYYPIFGGQQDHYLQQIVSPQKDVEGLNFKFHYNLYHNIRFIDPSTLAPPPNVVQPKDDVPPAGTVKSILPCTPLAVVKCLESIGVYNKLLTYGDRAYGKTITVINRSEVVGRPLAALLANDGARVFSVDIDSIQEYTKRPSADGAAGEAGAGAAKRQYHPRHTVHACAMSLEECLRISDVVVSAVPSAAYKVRTDALKDGCICVNVAAEKNFEVNIRDKASMYLPAVGKITILMLLRNLIRLSRYNSSS
ncbi:NAD(P)-binding protein [Coniophora puteana RWD-64-598 SS2]|uniref:NAD(P)-binding protein n=1 Tax=Coniophora puteana (strain RWD-64-598) TaxID=741705 RepID=A0A5M3MB32_CONPW|nr:NAD(P)-binding protein [Coniophora puteana RWD-64-598 SS2]EIW76293.1 NAD(P)-binding protein [Coniophora puteana RWD-64-598 SS2]